MYCVSCGNEVTSSDSNFCSNCGTAINRQNQQRKDNIINESTIQVETKQNPTKSINEEYDFVKIKQIGLVNMLSIRTKVTIKDIHVLIDRKKYYLGMIKGKNKTYDIKINDIDHIINKKSMDTIDGIYAAIFGVLTLITFNPVLLLLMAVCLWTGYGEKIFITTKRNEKIIIQSSKDDNIIKLVELINNNK